MDFVRVWRRQSFAASAAVIIPPILIFCVVVIAAFGAFGGLGGIRDVIGGLIPQGGSREAISLPAVGTNASMASAAPESSTSAPPWNPTGPGASPVAKPTITRLSDWVETAAMASESTVPTTSWLQVPDAVAVPTTPEGPGSPPSIVPAAFPGPVPVTVPPVTVAAVTVPPVTVAAVTVPPVTVPPVTVPPVTVPPVTVAAVTVPPVTVPPVTVPPVTVPPVTVPPVTVPPVVAPIFEALPLLSQPVNQSLPSIHTVL